MGSAGDGVCSVDVLESESMKTIKGLRLVVRVCRAGPSSIGFAALDVAAALSAAIASRRSMASTSVGFRPFFFWELLEVRRGEEVRRDKEVGEQPPRELTRLRAEDDARAREVWPPPDLEDPMFRHRHHHQRQMTRRPTRTSVRILCKKNTTHREVASDLSDR